MKVCLYTFQFPNYLGGVATYTYELYNYLVKNNHEVHVITRKHPKNIKVPGLHESRMLPIPVVHYITNGIDAANIIRKINPDIVHAQHGGPGLWMPKLNIPQILTVHSLSQIFKSYYSRTSQQGMFLKIGSPILKFIELQNFKNATDIISVYNEGKSNLINFYGVPALKITTIPNGVDLTKFNPSNRNEKLVEKYGKIILFSGTNDERKGIPELAKIIQEFNQKYKNEKISFIITGTGPLHQYLRVFARKYTNVHLLGYVSNEVLRELYASSYVFLFPTRIEAFPFSILEALSSGLPVITTAVGGIPDLFAHGADIGKLINPQKTSAVVEELAQLIEDEMHQKKQGHEASLLVRQHYNWESICKRLLVEYEHQIAHFK